MNTLFFHFYGKDVLGLDLIESWEPCENAKTVSRALYTVLKWLLNITRKEKVRDFPNYASFTYILVYY